MVCSCRRAWVLAALAGATVRGPAAHAETMHRPAALIARGTLSLPPNLAPPQIDEPAAIYVTVRPVPASALSAGKVPPLATARYAAADGALAFPYAFELTSDNLTPEGAAAEPGLRGSTDLLISARLDGDGVAATRGPDDLVGRASLLKHGSADPAKWAPLTVELSGRGITGRVLTSGAGGTVSR